jgi:hypothetical protein
MPRRTPSNTPSELVLSFGVAGARGPVPTCDEGLLSRHSDNASHARLMAGDLSKIMGALVRMGPQ